MIQPNEIMKTLGRAEHLDFPEMGLEGVPARIDTGARTSSIWASKVSLHEGTLKVVLLGRGNPLYTGEEIIFDTYETTVVASSTGHEQVRFKVRLLVKIKGKKIRAWFTLADRSTQVYPVLIGRNILLGKFVVDVKQGRPLTEEERKRSQALKARLGLSEEEKQ